MKKVAMGVAVVGAAGLLAFVIMRAPDTGGDVPPMDPGAVPAAGVPTPASPDPSDPAAPVAAPSDGATRVRAGATTASDSKIEGSNEIAVERARMRAESPEIQLVFRTQASWTEIARQARAAGDSALADEVTALTADLRNWTRQPDSVQWPDLLGRQQALAGTVRQSSAIGTPSVAAAVDKIEAEIAGMGSAP